MYQKCARGMQLAIPQELQHPSSGPDLTRVVIDKPAFFDQHFASSKSQLRLSASKSGLPALEAVAVDQEVPKSMVVRRTSLPSLTITVIAPPPSDASSAPISGPVSNPSRDCDSARFFDRELSPEQQQRQHFSFNTNNERADDCLVELGAAIPPGSPNPTAGSKSSRRHKRSRHTLRSGRGSAHRVGPNGARRTRLFKWVRRACTLRCPVWLGAVVVLMLVVGSLVVFLLFRHTSSSPSHFSPVCLFCRSNDYSFVIR